MGHLYDVSEFPDGFIERNRSTGEYVIHYGIIRKFTDLSGVLCFLECNGYSYDSVVMVKGVTCIGRRDNVVRS